MTASRKARAGDALGVLAALVAACGPSGPADPPLDSTAVFGTGEETLAEIDRTEAAMQEEVASCMREQGFRYEVYAARAPRFEDRGDRMSFSAPSLSSDWVDHARQHGYGYVANQRLLDIDEKARQMWRERHADPNAAYAATLSASRREAYFTALYGRRAADGREDSDHPWPPADPTAGCHGRAVVQRNRLTAVPEHLLRELGEIDHRIEVDPEVAAAQQAWESCMAGRGFRPAPAAQFRFDVQRDVLAIVERSGVIGEETVTVDVAGETFVVLVRRFDPAALQQARQKEVEAAADAECDRTSRRNEVRSRVRGRLQDDFVERNRAALTKAIDR